MSLVEVLRRRALEDPSRLAYTFLADGEADERTLSYGELDLRVRAVAARLQALGLAGERVLLLFPPGLDYPVAFLGCLAAAAVAVPAYPPTGSRGVPRLQAILADCDPRCILTTAALRPVVEKLGAAPLCLEIDGIAETEATEWSDPGLTADTLAFLQYTSGSTSTPKGVMVSHGNLVANERIIQEAIGSDESSVMVSWLPLYHDMGLIGGLLHPLWLGSSCVLLAPLHFLQRPVRWLRAVAKYGGVVSGAPNFAYELCVRKIDPASVADLDLSRWRVAFNGAEPVRAEALERFAAAFAGTGFRSSSFLPCYGLAETTLMVSGSRYHPEVTVFAADAARRLVSCGGIPSGVELRIVDPATGMERPAEGEGEVWVAGDTVAHGYWNRPDTTAETFGARLADSESVYLRTGDLGFLRGGELFITGRIKDLILIRGRNLYPQDVEWTAARSHPAARPDGGAAFTIDDGEERLVVVQEVAFRGVDLGEVAAAIRQAIAEEHEVPVARLVLVKPGGVPKTTSGKVQRRECKQLFLTGGLVPLGEWRDGEGDAARERVAPRTPAEARLAALWEEVLGLAPGTVGAEDNFFALGGDSLRGTQLLARLQETAGGEVSLEELFAAPTLAGLAGRLRRDPHPLTPSPTDGGGCAHTHPGEGEPSPLTSPQRRLWFLDRLEPGNPAYNLAVAVRLSGSLDADVLGRALAEIVRRHEALRTVFRVLDDVPAQVVLPADAVTIPLHRVDVAADPDPVQAAAELERELAREPFELERGPLLRARLVALGSLEHELHVAVHHIVSDGWSFGVLLREIALLYAAFAAGEPSPLPELPVQYGTYARWLEQRLAGEALEPLVAVWKRRLAGSLPVLELPADRPRPPAPSWRGAHATHVLPVALAGGLRGLAGTRGASLFMALAAGFQALLGRLTVQEDLILGTAVANRDRVELEGLIGFFVNTLALRTDLSGDPPFTALLERVRATALEALAGREVPFERLVDELRLRRDLSVPPIVQVMLVLQNEPLEVPPVPGLTLKGREIDNGTARFDLALSLLDTEEGLAAVWKYSRDLFDAATVDRMAGHFATLLAGAVADPSLPLSALPLLRAEELQQIVVDWNATDAPELAAAGCLHELIEAQVERTPGAPAVVFEGASLTYRELDDRASRLARHLRHLGVGPEVLVGVAVERSLELMVAFLAILKAGGAYVPLDPSYPLERLAFMVDDAAVPVLLTQDRLLGRVPAGRAQVICVDLEDKDQKDFKDNNDEEKPLLSLETLSSLKTLPDHPAYCIFTSGSTGRPKGAVNTHRAIVNRLLWMQSAYGLVPGEGVLQKTPVSFDVSVWELFWPLLVGARVVFARPGGHQDSAYLAGLIQSEQITTLHFVPSMLQVFLEEPRLGECASLRRVITSGEALPRELEERFGALLKAELHNLYGPTEAAVDVTFWPCLHEPEARTVPIGRPIANLRIHLLDPSGRPVPVGVPGHLHIGGAGLARGYLRRPELTAERFVPDPFGEGRLYATGDLARRRPDGVVEFLGRIDHQVKIRGFRIEMGEIEAVLNAHPAVRESVVLARTEGSGPRLVAYVVGTSPDVEALRAFLAARLPEYMVPPVFVVLPAFPLNPSGKVDRKALPAPEEPHRPGETPWVAPRTPVEERLAAVWRELLGVEKVGVHDDFFALGGDSIQGALLINRLQRELGAILYVMALFDAPTVAQLAAYLEKSYHDALVAAGWIAAGDGESQAAGPVDAAAEAAEIEALVHHLATRFAPAAGRRGPVEPRNRPAVFLLSPFRSGSTLLRVMLAGHPRLFAPPELELLGFETLGERRRVFAGRDSFSREGLLRAVMELRDCSAEEAAALMEEAEERDEPTPLFYRRLQEWAGGRLLVDKTPRYALDLATLRRAEDWFEAPLYVHLVRHPVATIQSYLEARMQEVYHFPLPQERQAELVWRLGHAHVLEHLAAVPAARQHRLLFEEMVRDPRAAMEGLCAFLGLDFAPAMLSPYEGKRMTDGLHGAGRMMGDPKFHQHRQIDAGVADRFKDAPENAWLGEATWALAGRLGYERPAGSPAAAAAAQGPRPLDRAHLGPVDLPLSSGQQRLWFLDRLAPGSSAYNMPASVRITGALDTVALAHACAEIERRHEVLRTTFPAAEGRPRQLICAPRPGLLKRIDLGGLPASRRQEEAGRLGREEALRPFDLADGPLWRVRLLRLTPEEHVLLVNLHHIVCDGWSVGLVTRELMALYQNAPLPDLPLQYADFAAWQAERLAGPVFAELAEYWKERLAGPLPILDPPLDRPRPQIQTHRGARLPVALAPEVAEALRQIGGAQGATLFMVLTAAFQAFLHRYSGQDDVLIGTPVASRNRAEIEDLIGLFVNTLVLRTDLSGDPPFRTLLARVRQVVVGATRHEEMPFERLVEELGVERTLDRSPLFSVLLVLQNALPGTLELPGLTLERLDVDTRTAKFELTLDLGERPDGGLAGALEYNTDLFDAATAERLARHFVSLAGGIAAEVVSGAGAHLSELPFLAEAERQELVVGWNATAEAVPDAPIHELILATARRVPEAVAVSCEGEVLRYGELAERVVHLAGHLAALGVGPDVLVALCTERSPSLVVALLAVLAAGGAYVPLDPSNPAERLGHILADAAAPILVTEASLLPVLPPYEGRIVLLEEIEGEGRGCPLSRVGGERWERGSGGEVLPDHLAYVIYTSGSTGRPKGVGVVHGALVNYVACLARHPGLTADDVMMAVTTLSFDIAVTELFVPLVVGARIELVRRETAADPARLAALIESAGATSLQGTPSTWALLLDGGWRGRPGLLAFSGGEALPRPLAERLLPRVGALWNVYGPTETTVYSALSRVVSASGLVPVGRPMGNQTVHLLGRFGELMPVGAPGELCIGGVGLARGYRGRPDLTADKFIPDPYGPPGARVYRTGDLARRLTDGEIEYLGRFDHQVKIRGFRVEIGEIEAALLSHPAVRRCVVMAVGEASDRLVAWVALDAEQEDLSWEALRAYLRDKLPFYMVPSAAVFLDHLPLLPSGKVDRKSLPQPGSERPDLAASYVAPDNAAERTVAAVWQEVLGLDRVGIDDNFFDLGGHSLLAAEVHGKLRERLGTDFPLLELFQYPTVRALAGRLAGRVPEAREAVRRPARSERAADPDVAVIGMACRFPGAPDLAAFWQNLRGGVDAISRLSDEELLAAGVDPALLANPRYVKARGVIPGADLFDAPFFGFSPREAAVTDPQQRIFLEQSWEALEHAGVDPATFPGRIGVYAGALLSTYLLVNLLSYGPSQEEAWPMVLANDKDTLATRVAYKLGLRGPALSVQTACSTSLVAIHLARQALLAGECDAALAGGITVRSPQIAGYLYQEDGILSPDGRCRAFDADGRGTVFGSGSGIVVLKRLADALEDGDTIHAVLKGSALNNDGEHKIGFTAPSADGQAEVISRALELAGVDPAGVQVVEAHGTATPLGDPIEVAGLVRAFREGGATGRGFCALGSVKTNIGHTDCAAGVAGLIKTVLALEHREIPPSLGVERPNPRIDFAASPFYVNDRLRPWENPLGQDRNAPRRAGVSSFGIGGTNAHAVLEEAPAPRETDAPARSGQLLVLSAKTPAALTAMTARLAGHLAALSGAGEEEGKALADVAFTLQVGRRALPFRRAVVCHGRADAVEALADGARHLDGAPQGGSVSVAFLFPGQGSQRPGMTAGLYAAEPVFRREVDRMAGILRPHLGGEDLREILYPAEARREEAARRLGRTSITQPALFVVETALARLWTSWGLRPRAFLGHSIGEYVAAHLAGVFSLEDALELVAARGRLIEELPGGAMLAVPLAEAEVLPLLGAELSLAAVNGPAQCVVSGAEEAVEALRTELLARGVEGRRLATSHAFHSRQMEPLLDPFTRLVRRATPAPPQIPFLSNVTGRWITAGEATDPAYWARHLRQTVRFAEGIDALLAEPGRVLLEVGPGRSLTRLARRAVPSLPPVEEGATEESALLGALGRLWAAGLPVDWPAFHAGERRRRVPLPSYPFERRRYWIEPAARGAAQGTVPLRFVDEAEAARVDDPSDRSNPSDPSDPITTRIAAIWREVLGVGRIGPHDRFFELGGDSLIALRVMARLQEAFGVTLPVRLLFEGGGTVPALRAAVEEALGTSDPAARAIPRRSGDGPAPLTFLQQQLWLLDQLAPGNPAYTMASRVRLAGRLDLAAFARAARAVVARHEGLRTVFRVEAGEPVQVVLPALEVGLPQVDLTALPPAPREAEARRLAVEEAGWRFDLAAGPLVRLVVVQLDPEAADLLLAIHHIVTDAWATGLFAHELGLHYAAFVRGEEPSLPPPPLHLADWAVWQRSHLDAMEEDLAWWCRQLRNPPAALELPTDRPRPAAQSFRGAAVPAGLAAPVTEALAELARREEATPFMVLLAGFLTLLARHSGQTDLLVATSAAGRDRKELEGVFGLFINTLVLRGDLAGEPGFRELLARVRATCLDAFSHQLAPFERILEAVRPGSRDLGRNPLFQVMFLLDPPLPAMELPGLSFQPQEREVRASMFDLTLFLHQRDGAVGGFLQYSTDLFDRATAERLAARWALLLEGAAAAPDRALADLPLLLPGESRQILGAAVEAVHGLSLAAGFNELLRGQIERTPAAPAVGFLGTALTYAELDRRVEQLARLLAAGHAPEGVVAVLAERGIELLTAILALFRAGLTYLPLDPHHPAHRHVQVLSESRAVSVLAAAELAPVAAEALAALPEGPRLLAFPDPAAAQEAPHRSWPDLAPRHLAYVIYTSGSTGVPKGAMVEHQGMLNHLLAKILDLELTAADTVAQTASQCFDISIWQFLAALLVGGRVEIFPHEVAQSPSLLLDGVRSQGVTILETVPSFLRALVEEASPGAAGSLRWMIPTGEALPLDLCNRWLELFPRIPLVNAYGPTECSDDITHAVLHHPLPAAAVAVPIGRPVVNLRLYVVSRAFQPQPLGVPGELCAGGIAVGRGYMNDALRTAAVFWPDPFAEGETGARLYRTGDLARLLPSGDLEFLGRIDHQVKIRGFRIELGEIEAALARHPAVRETVVLAREDTPGSRYLAAYVVPRSEALPAAELAAYLRGQLPDYMVPPAFVILPALPLTPNGKVDRKALPAPERSRDLDASFVAPSDPVEELLAGLWTEILGVERIGVHDDFFELGGHSLLATQVRSRLRTLLGVDLPLRTLFEAPTLGALAREVKAARPDGGVEHAPIPPLPPEARAGDLPLSFAQQRLWLIDQLDPGSAAYNLPTAVRLTGPLRPGLLEAVFAALLARHESLRTTFPAREGRPVQRVAPSQTLELPVLDLAGVPAGEREARAEALALEEARRPFDLQQGPLLRLLLLRLDAEEHLLVLTVHHIVSDGWSWGVLLRDVAALAAGSPLPELPVQYADFAVWQRGWLQGEVLEAQLAHWKQQLAGAPHVLDLPADRPRPAVPTHRGGIRRVTVPPAVWDEIAVLCRRRGATPFMALLAAWAVLLGRHANQQDVLIGTPVAGRNQREVEDLIGFFVNTLVIRAAWTEESGFGDLLARVREASLDAFTHQSLPFERLVDEIAPDRDLTRPPVFQAMLVLQNAPLGTLELPGLTLRQIPVDGGIAKFDLTLNLVELAGGRSFLEYDADLFDAATAERLLARWATLLTAVLAAPDAPLGAVALLPEPESWQLLAEWNDTETVYPTGVTLHELIAAQAEKTPLAIAAAYDGISLTYADLVGKARSLASHLATLGVPVDGRVGVFLERSLDMIVGLLGTLEAGAAYVPLDPTLPAERLRLLLESAGIEVVLTQERLAGQLPGQGERAVVLDRSDTFPLRPAGREGVGEGGQGDEGLAYVIYTSGSTGTPKGVMIPHRGIVNRLLWMQEAYGLTADDRVLQKTPFSFDVSLWEFFWPLLAGARLVFAKPEGHKDPLYLAELIAQEGITTLHFVPSMLQAFLAAPGLEALTSVKRVMASGEALPPELVRSFFQRMPHAGLHNLYGPTEASVDVSFWACTPEPPRGQVPIGRPIANHRLHVVDRHLELQPVGVHGELLLGGPGLARGYLGRPDLTAAAFVPDPFGSTPGERLYRTGDLVCHLPDGNVAYLGRIDHQVKVRGFRIELGEIETVLAAHPAVRECVVVARQDGPGDKMLAAYLVTHEPTPEAAVLSAWLGAKLPAYMIPAAFVVLPALPLSANGKIDRKALPAPSRPAAARSGGAPRTPAEVTLARIWSEILRAEQVGVADNFFALGGDSILSIQVAFRAREEGLAVAPRDLFLYRSLGELAAAVAAAAPAAATAEEPEGDLPLTPVQHWFFGLGLADPHHFNQSLVLDVRRPVDPALLEKALGAVVERHTALRLRFLPGEEGSWRQTVAETVVPLERRDLSHLPEAERRKALEAEAARLQASLRLDTGPLLRAVLFELGEGGQRLFLVLHHLIVDGVSWRILLADLESAVRSLAAGEEPALLPVGTSLGRWGARLAAEAGSASVVEELAFWQSRLRDARPLPRLETGGENTVASVRRLVAELDEEATRALLTEVPAAWNTQVNDALLTALAQAFAGWTGAPRLLVDLEGHGREEGDGADLSRTVGWLTAIYPVVLELDRRDRSPGDTLKSIKEQLRAIPRKGMGYGLLRYLGDAASVEALAALPAPQVAFNYLGQLDRGLPEGSLFAPAPEAGGPPASPRQRRPWLLEISGGVEAGRLRLTWAYSASCHDERTIQGVIDRFLGALRALIDHCRSTGDGGFTPSDFPGARAKQKDLDKLMARIGGRRS